MKVGERVQVVNRHGPYDGMIGTVKEIADVDHDYNVLVAFDGNNGSYRRAFRPVNAKSMEGAGLIVRPA